MSLKVKVLVLVFSAFSFLSLVGWGAQRWFIMPSFYSLEETAAREQMERVVHVIDRELAHLSVTVTDWASWDDTYQFVDDRNLGYIRSNLGPGLLEHLQSNLFSIFDRERELVWHACFDLETQAFIVVPDLVEQLRASPFSALTSPDEQLSGILATSIGPMLLAASPILSSSGQGPARGSLIQGRLLNAHVVSGIADLQMLDLVHEEVTPDLLPRLQRSEGMLVEDLGRHNRVHHLLRDLDQQPVALLSLDVAKDLSARGERAIAFALAWSLGAALLIALIVMQGLRMMVLQPLCQLSRHSLRVGEQGDLDARLNLQRADEIGVLAGEFDRMVQRLAEARARYIRENEVRHRQLLDAQQETQRANEALHFANSELSQHRDELEERVRVRALELAAARIEAESATVAKRLLLANMNHELRTPLNHIIGYGSLLKARADLAQIRPQLEQIEEAGQRLLRLISNILDAAQMQTGQLRLEEEDFDLHELIEKLHQELATMGHGSSELRLDIAADVPQWLRGDPKRLAQTLRELLDNAWKFSGGAPVTLNVSHTAEGRHVKRLRFEILDHGIGISPEREANLFQLFHQGDASFTRGHGGTGLGLELCRRLVQLMAGEIGYDRSEGTGSVFWIEIPLQLAQPPERVLRPAASGEEQHKLVADLLELLRENLAQARTLWQERGADLSFLGESERNALDEAIGAFDFDFAAQLLEQAFEQHRG